MKKIILFLALFITSSIAIGKETKTKNKINLGNVNINSYADENSALTVSGALKIANPTGSVTLIAPPDTGAVSYVLPGKDGYQGQILSTDGNGELRWITAYRTLCPDGYTLLGNPGTPEVLCVSTVQEPTNSWLGSITHCYNKNPRAHLCSAGEWAMLCISDKTFTNTMTGHWEWVADSGSNYGRIIGLAGCDSVNGAQVDAKYGSRCCVR